jgi:hypothetical protein
MQHLSLAKMKIMLNKITSTNGVLPGTVQRLFQGVLQLNNVRWFPGHTHTCNYTYTHTKCTAFPAPLFTKLTNDQQHYTQIKYTKFHTNHTMNAEKYRFKFIFTLKL